MPDLIFSYEIKLCEELKDAKPGQGMRVDFLYEGDIPSIEGIHIIWPEILDEKGNVLKILPLVKFHKRELKICG
ncbi:MAG: hypothetical protein OQK98_11540 [Gammaproteobacteria bacterium]|nr:hypothetical protein [Gammaproteobacteria bacterium]